MKFRTSKTTVWWVNKESISTCATLIYVYQTSASTMTTINCDSRLASTTSVVYSALTPPLFVAVGTKQAVAVLQHCAVAIKNAAVCNRETVAMDFHAASAVQES